MEYNVVFALFSLFGRGKRAVRGFFFYNIVYKGGRKTVRLIPLPPLYSCRSCRGFSLTMETKNFSGACVQ